MFAICSPYNHLLISALASILLLTLTAHAMPISQGAARPDSAVHDDDLNVHRRINKRSICPSEVPSDVIDQLKRDVMSKPHPMFLISEMAEMLHQEQYNHSNLGNCTPNQDALNETKERVFGTVLGYLNNRGVPSEDDVGCPPSYNISYHADRYPRYLVQVVCRNRSSEIVPRNEVQCSNSSDNRATRMCEPYRLGDMMYLTTNPPSGILCDSTSDPVWYICRATSIGVGCRFGNE